MVAGSQAVRLCTARWIRARNRAYGRLDLRPFTRQGDHSISKDVTAALSLTSPILEAEMKC